MSKHWLLGFHNETRQRSARDVIDFPRFSTRFAEEADLLVEVQRVFACLEEQDIGDGWVGYWHGVQPTSWGWDLGTPRWWEFVSSSA